MKPTSGMLALLGLEIVEVNPDLFVASWVINEGHLASSGRPHNGVYSSIHETAASFAGQLWLGRRGVIVGVNNSTDVVRMAHLGDEITCTGVPVFRNDREQLWDMNSVGTSGELIATGRVRLQNLDKPPPENYEALMSGHDE